MPAPLTLAQISAQQARGLGSGFMLDDWIVLGGYFLILAISGYWLSRRSAGTTEAYFLGGRQIPAWAVAISIVATSLSAVTFIGVPQGSYNNNLTYLATNIGMIIAATMIAFGFLPMFYRLNSASIYEVLEIRYGSGARKAASVMFLIGRTLASGARIYAGAIPASILLFGLERGMEPANLITAIALLSIVGIVYTLAGGISSVIWSDVIQFGILIGAALIAIVLIAGSFTAPASDILTQLQTGGPDGTSKLKLFDWSFDQTHSFSIPACVIGFTILGIGSYGTDQDLAQRMLTCKSAKQGAWSVISGILLGIPTVAIFLTVGLMLWVVYQRPELTSLGADAPTGDTVTVFLHYIMTQLPAGVRGLMMAGLFAAGLSSLNSAINAMSAAFVSDIYRPLATARSNSTLDDKHFVKVGRFAVVGWGLVLGGFACVCIFWRSNNNETLINFALGVMGIAYAGLVGVFFTALFTKRGSTMSIIAGLIAGFVWMVCSQGFFYRGVGLDRIHAPRYEAYYSIHFTWKLTYGVLLSTTICLLGTQPSKPSADLAAPRDA